MIADSEAPTCGQKAADKHETFPGHQQPLHSGGLQRRPQKEEERAPMPQRLITSMIVLTTAAFLSWNTSPPHPQEPSHSRLLRAYW